MNKVYLIALVLMVSQTSFAEAIFYTPKTKLAEVNCQTGVAIVDNMQRSQMTIRTPVDERYAPFCERLSQFAASAKPVTLLTVEAKSIGDFIYKQEIVGIVDVDYIVSAMSVVSHDLVQTRLCGSAGKGARSQSKVCLMVSREGLYFIEATSAQSGHFAKTTVVSAAGSDLSLESKDSKGTVEMTLSGTWSPDRKTFTGKVGFENGEIPVVLNSAR